VFDPTAGELKPLPAVGWYFRLRAPVEGMGGGADDEAPVVADLEFSSRSTTSIFQPGDAYQVHETGYSLNLVFSPTPRIDCGIEYVYGTRENFDGLQGAGQSSAARRDISFF